MLVATTVIIYLLVGLAVAFTVMVVGRRNQPNGYNDDIETLLFVTPFWLLLAPFVLAYIVGSFIAGKFSKLADRLAKRFPRKDPHAWRR